MKGAFVDISQFKSAMDKSKFSVQEVMDILGAGAAVVKTTQKLLVPVDTGATRASIKEYFDAGQKVSHVDIGPSTEYAPYIEYGTSNPNYPIKPFIVPSITGMSLTGALNAIRTAIVLTLIGRGSWTG